MKFDVFISSGTTLLNSFPCLLNAGWAQ